MSTYCTTDAHDHDLVMPCGLVIKSTKSADALLTRAEEHEARAAELDDEGRRRAAHYRRVAAKHLRERAARRMR